MDQLFGLELVNQTADEFHIVVLASGRGLVDEVVLQGDLETEGLGQRGFHPNFGVDQIVVWNVYLREEFRFLPDAGIIIEFVSNRSASRKET